MYAVGRLNGGKADRRNEEPATSANKIKIGESIAVGMRRLFVERFE